MTRCENCSRFRKDEDVILIGGEYDEEWTECVYCMSESDLETYKLKRKITTSKHTK